MCSARWKKCAQPGGTVKRANRVDGKGKGYSYIQEVLKRHSHELFLNLSNR